MLSSMVQYGVFQERWGAIPMLGRQSFSVIQKDDLAVSHRLLDE